MTPTDRAMLTCDVAELGLPKDALDLLAEMRDCVDSFRFLAAEDVAAAGPLIKAGLVSAQDGDAEGITLSLTGWYPTHDR